MIELDVFSPAGQLVSLEFLNKFSFFGRPILAGHLVAL
jgi:hypothetical protein